MGLTGKQARFVAAYVGSSYLNATGAARAAGYAEKSAHVEGHRQLRKAKVNAAIAERLKGFSMSAAEATERMSAMARGHVPTKTVNRTGGKDGATESEEYSQETALDKVLRLHGAYENSETEVKFLIVKDLADVVPTTGDEKGAGDE